MASSGGGVREKANGRWEGRGRVDGKDISVSAATKRECQELLRDAMVRADNGIRPTAGRLTVGSFLAEWLDTSVTARCRPRTVDSYRETVRRYITPRAPAKDGALGDYLAAPSLGRVPLAKLTPGDITRMLAGLTARGDLSPTTVRYAYAILRIALGRALKEGKVMRNVATLVDPPAKARHELTPLSADEARQLIEGTAGDPTADPPVPPDRLHALYATAVATGMRQGELLGLRWLDVDLAVGTLAVRHSLERRTRVPAEPKTDRGRRTLRLGAGAIAILRDHKTRQRFVLGKLWSEEGYVFLSRAGTPLDRRNVTQDLQTALKRLGLPHQRFHDLRHAYATLMLEDGEELAVVSRSLGHADLSTTADVYAHLTPAMLERAAARMDRILGKASAG